MVVDSWNFIGRWRVIRRLWTYMNHNCGITCSRVTSPLAKNFVGLDLDPVITKKLLIVASWNFTDRWRVIKRLCTYKKHNSSLLCRGVISPSVKNPDPATTQKVYVVISWNFTVRWREMRRLCTYRNHNSSLFCNGIISL